MTILMNEMQKRTFVGKIDNGDMLPFENIKTGNNI